MTAASSDNSGKDEIALPPGLSLGADGMLRREDFTSDRLEWYRKEIAKRGGQPFLTPEEREASRRAMFAALAQGSDVWVFGYGSLMWNPAIHVSGTSLARARGLCRRFALTLELGRGTPEKPGLMLVVEDAPQETCWGVAHRIAPEHLESETGILWSREMLTGAYEPRWIDLERDEGPLRAFTFTVNRAHPRYTGALPPEEIARRIAQAEGILGTNRDYLYRTHACLAAHGLDDAHISDIFARVCRLTGDRPDHLPAGA
ncbi:MAG TPA: gamma-glutamylcyclotransferase [Micropepsaceae bacterium]|nr:gamma-glutamylcyclotransferase [Micropepsaceae bacterium]